MCITPAEIISQKAKLAFDSIVSSRVAKIMHKLNGRLEAYADSGYRELHIKNQDIKNMCDGDVKPYMMEEIRNKLLQEIKVAGYPIRNESGSEFGDETIIIRLF